jgi:TonB family protein
LKSLPLATAFLLTSLAASAEPPGTKPAQRKLPAACAQTEWPAEARRYELEGATAVEYKVGKDGRVADIKLVRSSGWALLDGMALRTLGACKFDADDAKDARYTPIEFRWALSGGYMIRPELQPNSCASSDRFAAFIPLDKSASSANGMLVRLLVNGRGEPFNVKAEHRPADAELAALAADYVKTCRFAAPSKGPDARTDTTYGRVVYK